MSPSGVVIIRLVNPLSAPAVCVSTVFAPTSRSVELVVVSRPLLLTALLPMPPSAASSVETVFIPLYSKMRISGAVAGVTNETVTVFAPAAAALMFAA
jgi:hypothetical protein